MGISGSLRFLFGLYTKASQSAMNPRHGIQFSGEKGCLFVSDDLIARAEVKFIVVKYQDYLCAGFRNVRPLKPEDNDSIAICHSWA